MDFEQVHFKRSSRFDETFRLYFLLLVSIIKIDAGLNFWFLLYYKQNIKWPLILSIVIILFNYNNYNHK
jgi:hypothetical protein